MKAKFWIIAAQSVWLFHWIVVLINTFAAFWILATFPWFVGFLIITLLLSPFVGGDRCILNHIENYCRVKGGLEPKSFERTWL